MKIIGVSEKQFEILWEKASPSNRVSVNIGTARTLIFYAQDIIFLCESDKVEFASISDGGGLIEPLSLAAVLGFAKTKTTKSFLEACRG